MREPVGVAVQTRAPFVLAIVGGGPTCTYALERLAAVVTASQCAVDFTIRIFDRYGQFGAGETHSALQPQSSVLNRICGQISFGADATIGHASGAPTVAPWLSLHEWCLRRFEQTGDPAYRLEADSWPKRFIHGQALQDAFETYVNQLRNHGGVTVTLHSGEVVNVIPQAGDQWVLELQTGEEFKADHLLFATGHGAGRPRPGTTEAAMMEASVNGAGAFIPYAYPLERNIVPEATGPDKSVCSIGLGLTAIDLILYLTEGRDGYFTAGEHGLEYCRSGNEPAAIIGCSPSGLFTYARATNQKEADLDRLQHRGVFLLESAVDRLRTTVGNPIQVPEIGERRQLDFTQHLLPLILLEMNWIYYRTLLGPQFAEALERSVAATMDRFLDGAHPAPQSQASFDACFEPLVRAAFDAISHYLNTGEYREAQAACATIDLSEMLDYFLAVVESRDFVATIARDWAGVPIVALRQSGAIGTAQDGGLDPHDYRFDWDRLCNPLKGSSFASSATYNAAVVRFMELDHRRARQGNLSNPWKAACDGVWRDLRSTLTYAVDRGGLTAASHQEFLTKYLRLHNRLANGACLEVMEKMLALIKCGLLDLGTGPLASITSDPDTRDFRIRGSVGERSVSTVIDSKLHSFDPEHDGSALYRNMFAHGLVRKWRNPGVDGVDFEPGGLDLTERFHPFNAAGDIVASMTFLGPPTEGILFFQVGAARPNQNHHVLNDVITWIEEIEPVLQSVQVQ